MRKGTLAILFSCFLIVGFADTGLAFPDGSPHSLKLITDHHDHKKNCMKIFECEYYAPATACSQPPCCKRGHWHKVCDE
jgi:hypothetical protein